MSGLTRERRDAARRPWDDRDLPTPVVDGVLDRGCGLFDRMGDAFTATTPVTTVTPTSSPRTSSAGPPATASC